jgi:hypothetical protein
MTAQIKRALVIAGLVVAAILAGLVVYGNYQHVMYQQGLGASKTLTAEYNAYKSNAETAIAAKNAEIAQAAKDKLDALAQANAAAQSQAATQAELNRLKAETAALPPDALSGKINAFIGDNQTRPTADGRFSFTRPGADNTLNIFYERDAFKAQYSTEQSVSQSYRLALDKSDAIILDQEQKYTLKDGEYQKALAAWSSDKDALKHLQRSIFGLRTKSFLIGAGIGAAAVIIYNLIKPADAAIDSVAVINQ